MPWIHVNVSLTITLDEPLHIGSGFGRGLIQRAVVRARSHGRQRRVYIPGSSIKGKVRNACEELARAADLKVCGAPNPQAMCKGKRCLVCRTFGRPGDSRVMGRHLHWHDAHPTEAWQRELDSWPGAQVMARTQVQLSRGRGVALEDRLYTGEFVAPSLSFAAKVSGWLEATSCEIEYGYYELNLLMAGLRSITSLGGSRSRGAGHCTVTLPEKVAVREDGESEARYLKAADLLAAAAYVGLFGEE